MIPADLDQRIEDLAVDLRAQGHGLLDCRELLGIDDRIDQAEMIQFLEVCRHKLYLRVGDLSEGLRFAPTEKGWMRFEIIGDPGQPSLGVIRA